MKTLLSLAALATIVAGFVVFCLDCLATVAGL